ncbi:MAG: PAS domain S-box protein, partial [Desulfobacula sp.]|nr:PAS domain S-box protein [Desulfobacula sp.]
ELNSTTVEFERVKGILKEKEEFNSCLLDNSPHPIIVINPDTSVRYVNPALEKLTGYSSEEILGTNAPYLWWTKTTLKKTHGNFSKALQIGAKKIEELFIKKNGALFWVEITLIPTKHNEKIKYYLANWVDITERKQAEEALKKSKERLLEANIVLSGILDHTHMMVAFIDVRFNFIWVNHAYAAADNHEPSFFIGKNHFELYPHEENQAIFQRVVDTGEPFFVAAKQFEYPNHPESGLTYWDWSLIPIKDDDGIVTRLVFTLAEVTEAVRDKEMLSYRKLQFEEVLNNLDSSIYISDMESNEIFFMNDHMKKLFGADLTGNICWKSFYENQDEPCKFCTNDKLIDTDGNSTEPYVWEVYNQKLEKWYEMHDQAIPWIDGHLVRLEIAIDITNRKQSEEEREKLIGELQAALAEIKKLSGLLPICAHCKKIRDDKGYWNNLEEYIQTHSDAEFSHGICPECSDELYGKEDWYIEMKKGKQQKE